MNHPTPGLAQSNVSEDYELLEKFEQRVLMHHDAEAENDRLREALRRIAFLRPAGATPKLVSGALIEQIEKIALAALARDGGAK